jgi:hypothetical protein
MRRLTEATQADIWVISLALWNGLASPGRNQILSHTWILWSLESKIAFITGPAILMMLISWDRTLAGLMQICTAAAAAVRNGLDWLNSILHK